MEQLETILASLRSVIADRWDDCMLVSPVRTRASAGTIYSTVNALVGSGMPFRQVRLVTTELLDDSFLYLVHGGGPSALQLLPLVSLMPSPSSANIACYFYNRLDGEQLRYVSYYFEEAPETTVAGSDVTTSAVLHALGIVG